MKKHFSSLLLIVFPLFVNSSEAQLAIKDAEQSFNYVSNTLNTFKSTGRLVNNPGIDGSDLEAFIVLLEYYYDEFSRDFNRDSLMCEFYRDPENSRMTIEEKAEISFSFLSSLENRIDQYIAVNEDFQDQLADEFGTILLDNVNEIKTESTSNLRLPTLVFDEAAVISFIDSSCT